MLVVQLTRLAWSPRLASQRFVAPPRCSAVCTLADPPILAEAEAFFAERGVRLHSVQAGVPYGPPHLRMFALDLGVERAVQRGNAEPAHTHEIMSAA